MVLLRKLYKKAATTFIYFTYGFYSVLIMKNNQNKGDLPILAQIYCNSPFFIIYIYKLFRISYI